MRYNPAIHHRRSLRLKGHDYSEPGYYYITICTQGKKCLFGDIDRNQMTLNKCGQMINTLWLELPIKYPGIAAHDFIVMPNHIHGIIEILAVDSRPWVTVGAGPRACPRPEPLTVASNISTPLTVASNISGDNTLNSDWVHCDKWKRGQARGPAPTSIPDIIRNYKSLTTKRFIEAVGKREWEPFYKRLWQRNYYEHIYCA